MSSPTTTDGRLRRLLARIRAAVLAAHRASVPF